MGRYYSGDIEGKFWFAVQSSDDANFFGVTGEQPSRLEYFFSGSDLPEVEKGVRKCKLKLGENKAKLDKFFADNMHYNDEMLVEAGFKEVPELLEWYARLKLGEKIAECIKTKGECEFEAEL